VRGASGLGLERERDQALDLVVSDSSRSPGAGPVDKAVQPMRRKAGPPCGHARAAHPESTRHTRVGRARLGTGLHNAGPLHESLARAALADEPLQLGSLMLAQVKRDRLGSACHGTPPPITKGASAQTDRTAS